MSGEGDFIFDNPVYRAARENRLRSLFRYLDSRTLRGKRILEVGCGTGELGQAFADFGCKVVSLDARVEYIDEVRRRYPGREAYAVDLEHWDPAQWGGFDAILCFGLLYHLSRPSEFLTECAHIAPELYLETVVTDSLEPVCPILSESGPDQAFSGHGCRPSSAWIQQTMNGLGFQVSDISSGEANWEGECPSVFDWTPANDGAAMRGAAFLRKMFLCTRAAGLASGIGR